jgi:hypothetical protein
MCQFMFTCEPSKERILPVDARRLGNYLSRFEDQESFYQENFLKKLKENV